MPTDNIIKEWKTQIIRKFILFIDVLKFPLFMIDPPLDEFIPIKLSWSNYCYLNLPMLIVNVNEGYRVTKNSFGMNNHWTSIVLNKEGKFV